MNGFVGLDPALRPFVIAWVLLAGAAVGSFLNVVIARVPHGESILRPRSRCPRCKAPIAWYDNVPVLSWVLLRARCRRCGAPISFRYPLVEALGAAAAWLAFERHGLSFGALAEVAFADILLALAFIDLDTWLLPNALTWPLIGGGVALGALGLGAAPSFTSALYGAGIGFAAFALIAFVGEKVLKKEALGFGDVWLLSGLGAFVGVAALLPIVLLASIQGSIVGIALILMGKGEPGPEPEVPPLTPALSRGEREDELEQDWVPPKHAVPFGPFLALGALEWLYLSDLVARAVPTLEVFR